MWDRPIKSADELIRAVQAGSCTASPCVLTQALQGLGRKRPQSRTRAIGWGSVGSAHLVQSPFGVSQKGDAVALSDADGHGGEASGRIFPRGVRVQRGPAGHWTGGVVRAAGVRLHRVLCSGGGTTTEMPSSFLSNAMQWT